MNSSDLIFVLVKMQVNYCEIMKSDNKDTVNFKIKDFRRHVAKKKERDCSCCALIYSNLHPDGIGDKRLFHGPEKKVWFGWAFTPERQTYIVTEVPKPGDSVSGV